MDEYYASSNPAKPGAISKEMKQLDTLSDIGIDSFGTTTNPFEHQTSALKARIFHGANKIEMGFFGQGKGRKEAATPESFGARERMDMRELAEFNEITTTTHASVGVSGLSGLDMRQGSFDDQHRKETIDEIKRAIHFAAEATTGGAVVFHTGEAPRNMLTRLTDKEGNPQFMMHNEEKDREQFMLVDPITRKLSGVKRNDLVAVPIIRKEKGSDGKEHYKYLTNGDGSYVQDPILQKFDKIHEGRTPIYELDVDGTIKVEQMSFNKFLELRKEEYKMAGKWDEVKNKDDEYFAREFHMLHALNQVQYNINFARLSKGQYEEAIKQKEDIEKALNFYKDMQKKVPKEDWWKFQQQAGRQMPFMPPDTLDPVEYLEKALNQAEATINRQSQFDILGKRQALETLEMVKRLETAPEFAVKESAKSLSELGRYAMQFSQKAHNDYKSGKAAFDLKEDIYLAPENLFPELYGAQPKELRKIIETGREQMIKDLVTYDNKSESEAKKLAEKHIKATFDIGHANIWKKYFVAKPGETEEQKNTRFNKWLLKETESLVKDGIIGHVHISDNMGFHDEHLTAGDGNSPIKDFIKQVKENSTLREFIVESGSFNPNTSLPDTWMHFDSPVYGLQVSGFAQNKWTDVYRSYFGRTEPPRYVVGEYSPSEEFKGSPFYTGLGME
ncbi:MAG: sugar phosphate isomerase/epimerase [Nanoarchaeota archaeon]|nr:sugar phosphate isomerase/epimerase [Nanoarchaeota archaeon]